MNLHENKQDFQDLINLTSQYLQLEEIYIEKDYFVVLALKNLALSEHKQNGIFKGGTSLSKVFRVIKRFSEDIDIAVVKDNGVDRGSPNQVKAIEKALTSHQCFDINESDTHRTEKLRKIVCNYPRIGQNNNYGQIHSHINIDISRIMPGVPFEEKSITCYIHDYLKDNSNQTVIDEYDLNEIKVNTLRMERTFVEKIIALANYSTLSHKGLEPIERLKKGIRHIYDLHQMLQEEPVKEFSKGMAKIENKNIQEFIDKVLQQDLDGMRQNDEYQSFINSDFSQCILYNKPDEIWEKLEQTYNGEFKRILFGSASLPNPQDIIGSLQEVRKVCEDFNNWKITNNRVYQRSV